SACVECHMPSKTYMVVDPRRDHSIRVPRPDLTLKIGTPNACQPCHTDKPPEWAAEKVVEWYGPKRAQDPHYGEIIAAGRAANPAAESALIDLAKHKRLLDKAHSVGGIVRATAVSLLGRYGSSASREALERALRDDDPLVRTAAIRQVDQDRQVDERASERLRRLLVPLLDDKVRLVRTEAARTLTVVPMREFTKAERARFDVVLAEWRAGLQETIDDAGAHLAYGLVDANLGQTSQAREEYLTAIRLHPTPIQAVQARVQLAMLEHEQGHNAEAEKLYREVIEQEPKWEQGFFSLGLLLAEDANRLTEATEALGKAAELAPTNARMQYNYGLALQRLGKPADAEKCLLAADKLAPDTFDFMNALAILFAQQRKWDQALRYAERLARIDPRMESLVGEIREQAKQPRTFGPATGKQ
ncbi:MAG TPA: HEAT repeat domain-containing protein, partial [Pirellulales bacterium]|nr:HEAT repeat domain-containing protein [Pirellulales bacterium]